MPKREYPFEELVHNQCKIHVGEKEVNLGVATEKMMHNVYEKTFALLLNGAKIQAAQKNPENLSQNIILNRKLETENIGKSFRQLQLKQEGTLHLNGLEKPAKNSYGPSACSSCSRNIQGIQEKCYFCEKLLCDLCYEICFRCREKYCRLCTVKMYNQQDDTALCLNCFK